MAIYAVDVFVGNNDGTNHFNNEVGVVYNTKRDLCKTNNHYQKLHGYNSDSSHFINYVSEAECSNANSNILM